MTYKLKLLGFRNSPTDPTVPVNYFLSDEGHSNTAWLFATFEAVGCGDGVLDPGEECDDGNLDDGDGCDRFCKANEAPVAVCQDQTLQADAQCQACGSVDGGSYDPDSLVWSVVESPVCPWGLGQTTVGLTITDTDGESDACSAHVTVVDATAPVIGSCPAAEELVLDATCHASGTYTATASDNCTGSLSVSHSYTFDGAGSSGYVYAFGDDSGNTASCTQTVSAADKTAPTLACPADTVLDLDGACAAHQSYTATGADNCADALSATREVSLTGVGETVVSYEVTDGTYTATCQQVVATRDQLPPTATCALDATLALDGASQAAATYAATSIDNCSGTAALSHTFSFAGPGSETYPFAGPGSQTWSYAFADASGNGASCAQTVTAEDSAAPIVTPAGGAVVLWPPNRQYERVTLADCGAAFDGCEGPVDLDGGAGSILTVTSDEPEDAKGNGDGATRNDMVIVDGHTVDLRAERVGTGNGRVYTITYEVSDASGNTTTATCQVGVPHDQGKGSTPVAGAPVYQVP